MHSPNIKLVPFIAAALLAAGSGCAAPAEAEQETADWFTPDPDRFVVATNCVDKNDSRRRLSMSYKSDPGKTKIISVRAAITGMRGEQVLTLEANVIQTHDSNTLSPTMLLAPGATLKSTNSSLNGVAVTQVMLIPESGGFFIQGPAPAGQTQLKVLTSLPLAACINRERVNASMSMFPKLDWLRAPKR